MVSTTCRIYGRARGGQMFLYPEERAQYLEEVAL